MSDRIPFTQLAEDARSGRVDVPDHWKQGRTAYGGLTAAVMLEAARAQVQNMPPLRSALVNFTGPVTGAPALSAEVLRQGRNVTTVSARAVEDGKPVGTATFSFGASRDSSIGLDRSAPGAPAPQDCPPFIPTIIGVGGLDWPAVAAGATIFLMPVLIFTVLLRKHLLRGITFGAVRK